MKRIAFLMFFCVVAEGAKIERQEEEAADTTRQQKKAVRDFVIEDAATTGNMLLFFIAITFVVPLTVCYLLPRSSI